MDAIKICTEHVYVLEMTSGIQMLACSFSHSFIEHIYITFRVNVNFCYTTPYLRSSHEISYTSDVNHNTNVYKISYVKDYDITIV